MVVSFSLSCGPGPSVALREQPTSRPDGLYAHRRHRGGPCPLQPEKRKVHSLEKPPPMKAVSLVAAGVGGCRFAVVGHSWSGAGANVEGLRPWLAGNRRRGCQEPEENDRR